VALVIAMMPAMAFAEDGDITVKVTIKNDSFTSALVNDPGTKVSPRWTGTLVDKYEVTLPTHENATYAIEKACSLPEGCSGYDLYLTGYEHSFSVSHLAVLNRTVVGLAEDNSMDIRLCEAHIRDMVRKDEHVGYDVHIYRDLDEYIRTLQDLSSAKESMEESMEGSMEGSMEESMEESPKDSAGTPSGSSHASSAEDRAVMKMILGISI
jgi:hypothetical protein